jgi:hypothetical protein
MATVNLFMGKTSRRLISLLDWHCVRRRPDCQASAATWVQASRRHRFNVQFASGRLALAAFIQSDIGCNLYDKSGLQSLLWANNLATFERR